MVWYSCIFRNFLTVKGFSLVNVTEVDIFLEFLCYFYDPVEVGDLISGCSAFFKPSFYIGQSVQDACSPGELWEDGMGHIPLGPTLPKG